MEQLRSEDMSLRLRPTFKHVSSGVLALLTLGLLSSCQTPSGRDRSASPDQTQAIQRLNERLERLETRIDAAAPTPDQGDRVPPGPIKSITFRSGTADDRVRIYWANGERSNLPCTLEQGTWACG